MIDILILTLNNSDTLSDVLEAIKNNTDDNYRIYIFDNNSNASFKEQLEKIKSKKIDIEFSSINIGVAPGRQRLAEKATSEFIMFLDSDMIVSKKWDYWMKRQFEYVHAGAVGARFSLRGKDSIHFNGGIISVESNYFLIAKELDKSLSFEDPRTFRTYQCDWLAGGVMMITREINNLVKYDRNSYKVGFEDIDFSLRILQNGYNLYNCPQTKFIHLDKNKGIGFRRSKIELSKSIATFFQRWKLNPIKSWDTDKFIVSRSLDIKTAQAFTQDVIDNIDNNKSIMRIIKKYA